MKGILFKPEMHDAILEGLKTQTMRVDKLANELDKSYDHKWIIFSKKDNHWLFKGRSRITNSLETFYLEPRYKVGEILYIKESYKAIDFCLLDVDKDYGRTKIEYKDGEQNWVLKPKEKKLTIPDIWHSPMMMPEYTARHFIQITESKPQRLQTVLEKELISEGIEIFGWEYAESSDGTGDRFLYWEPEFRSVPDILPKWASWASSCECVEDIFSSYWDFINKKNGYSYDTNPWIWRYGFIMRKDIQPSLNRKEFEALLTKSAQPLPEQGQQPDSESKKTSESRISDDCSERNTHSDRTGDT